MASGRNKEVAVVVEEVVVVVVVVLIIVVAAASEGEVSLEIACPETPFRGLRH